MSKVGPNVMGDKTRRLYEKFDVRRTDGTSEPGQKHDGCQYFVLDLTHDPFADEALSAYARACRHEYPLLAKNITTMRLACKAVAGKFFTSPSGHGR